MVECSSCFDENWKAYLKTEVDNCSNQLLKLKGVFSGYNKADGWDQFCRRDGQYGGGGMVSYYLMCGKKKMFLGGGGMDRWIGS